MTIAPPSSGRCLQGLPRVGGRVAKKDVKSAIQVASSVERMNGRMRMGSVSHSHHAYRLRYGRQRAAATYCWHLGTRSYQRARGHRVKASEREAIREVAVVGTSLRELARQLGASHETIRTVVRERAAVCMTSGRA
jgi:IS30 family transposase